MSYPAHLCCGMLDVAALEKAPKEHCIKLTFLISCTAHICVLMMLHQGSRMSNPYQQCIYIYIKFMLTVSLTS